MGPEFLILKPLNPMFFILLFLTAAFVVLFVRLFRHRSERTRRLAVALLYAAVTVIFIIYKVMLSLDDEYSVVRMAEGLAPFNWWDEIPLHLCNINMVLVIFSSSFNNKPLLCFNFFLSTLGACFALLLPSAGFAGYSVFLPRMLGYYVTHFMILAQMPLLAWLDIYRPHFRDLPFGISMTMLVASLITGVNFLLRKFELAPRANFFYTMEPDGNAILEKFYQWLPVPGVYVIWSLGILVPYMLIVTYLFELYEKKHIAKSVPAAENTEAYAGR